MSFIMDSVGMANTIVGFILTVFGLGTGLFVWLHKRMKTVAADVMKGADGSHEKTVQRVGQLEGKVESLADDVGKVRSEVQKIGGRVSGVERSMETVARQKDVTDLGREFAGLKASFETQTHTLTHQISMLFQQAMKSGKDN